MQETKEFKPFISADKVLPELTPFSIILGILLGIVTGMLVVKFYQKVSMRKVVQVFVLLSISFLRASG